MKAIDISSAPPPTQQQVDCLRAAGIEKVIVGTSYTYGGSPAKRVAAYQAAGFLVAEYQFPGDLRTPITGEVWIDVEDPPGTNMNEVRSAVSAMKPKGIYSNQTMWAACGLTGWNIKAEFPWLKAWVADYGPLPRPWRPFGGFGEQDVAIWQYEGNATLCGLSVDLNLIVEEHMPTAEYDELKEADKKLGLTLIDHAKENNAVLKEFGNALFDLAKHVYGDTDQRVAAIEGQLKQLDK